MNNDSAPPTRFSFYQAQDDYSMVVPTEEDNQNNTVAPSTPPPPPNEATSQASNPYEDAIKEALDLLRKHKPNASLNTPHQTPAIGSPVQSQIATNGNVLLSPSTNSDVILQSRNDEDYYQAEIENRRKQRQQRMAKYASRLRELKSDTTQQEPKSDDDEEEAEVQKGVEKVLLAILQKANPQRIQENQTTISITKEQLINDNTNKTEQDILIQAMSDLLKPSSTNSTEEEERSIRNRQGDEILVDELDQMVLQAQQNQPSVEDKIDRRVRQVLSSNSGSFSQPSATLDTQEDEEEDDWVQNDDHKDERSLDSSLLDDDDDDDDDDRAVYSSRYDDDDEKTDCHENLDGLLGPLGGATGVVLEAENKRPPPLETSPSILESISAAAASLITGVSPGSTHDKCTLEDGDGDDDDDENGDDNQSTHGLMLSLCSHLLPSGLEEPSSSRRSLDSQPYWDDTNPDETGYRIVRLTQTQLRAIERAFTQVVENRTDAASATTDEIFERDLQAAEDLLDKAEKSTSFATAIIQSPRRDSVDQGLDDFPGVKLIGNGEMGDLEYFQLPIIFKSNVTGFEPTKDLYLEAGNIVAGQYLVEGELGSAAFSTAYCCVDLNSEGEGPDGHEKVCLKVIKNTKDYFDQSLDEIKILELLRQTGAYHENYIVEMKTFFYYREHLFIVTELLRQNLFEFGKFIIENNEEPYFTIDRLGYITRQALIALRFVHKLGLVHSDVKPENILLGSYSRAKIKLIDFGSSCYLTDRQSSYIQSRSYRAPEVILGLPYDGRIDIWSLGCVVAEMFTGEVTFQNDSIIAMMSRIEAICGPFPRHMISQGRQSENFFTKCGLLYEKVRSRRGRNEDDDDESDTDPSSSDKKDSSERSYSSQLIDIFQPKKTTLSARLGFVSDLIARYDDGAALGKEESRQAMFVDFIRKLLTIDPDGRPTAAQALDHPYMQYAATLTEDDIMYPSK